jgi:hypothetical protein
MADNVWNGTKAQRRVVDPDCQLPLYVYSCVEFLAGVQTRMKVGKGEEPRKRRRRDKRAGVDQAAARRLP